MYEVFNWILDKSLNRKVLNTASLAFYDALWSVNFVRQVTSSDPIVRLAILKKKSKIVLYCRAVNARRGRGSSPPPPM